MIGYLDTSAFVPLLVTEPGSESCRRFWDDADTVVTNRLLYVETAAALAQAHRMDRLTDKDLESSLHLLADLWTDFDVIEVDQTIVERAAVLARQLGLRGYDAVHCASAEQLSDHELVAASGDRKLLDAWNQLGIDTFDTHAEQHAT